MNSLGTNYVHGSALGWAMLNGMNSCLGVSSAPLVNVRLQFAQGTAESLTNVI